MVVITQAESDAEIAAVRALIREFTAYAFTLLAPEHQELAFAHLEAELERLPGIYVPPAGRLLLATVGGDPAGTVTWIEKNETTCELKRQYVRPVYRGRGLGWKLVQAVVDDTRAMGYERVVLVSHVSMERANAVYEAFGFRRVDAPSTFPMAYAPYILFMECLLAGSR
jgi:ribosomal protein S18 acetylase RimI-like enzyme